MNKPDANQNQRDPTLRGDMGIMGSEDSLINRVKSDHDSQALLELINRHSGIYFSVVNKYAACYPDVIKTRDLEDDKMFNLYQFILAFNPDKGSKLSTYIGSRTDFLCKTLLRKENHDPLSSHMSIGTGCAALSFVPPDIDDDTFITTNGSFVTLKDEGAKVEDIADRELGLEQIREVAKRVCNDALFESILLLRCCSSPRYLLSWRDIGKRVGCSHENARQIFNRNIELVKTHLEPLTPSSSS